jgi:co-chaperonin GroES (HSP10)
MSIKAAPGIYLIQEIKEKNLVNTGTPKDKKILKGTIIDVGPNRDHDSGGKLISTFKVGDVVWFLNYQESYDWFEDGNVKYYCVLFNDTRAYQA